MIINNEGNNNFYFQKNFHFFKVDNQDIFDTKKEIQSHFFANYNKDIFVNLAFL